MDRSFYEIESSSNQKDFKKSASVKIGYKNQPDEEGLQRLLSDSHQIEKEDFSVIQPEILKQLAKQSADRSLRRDDEEKQKKQDKIEIRIKFESRLHKDKFLAYIRAIKSCRVVILDGLLEKFHEVVSLNLSGLVGLNSMNQEDERHLDQLEKMIDETKNSVSRIVDMNKTISDVNSNLEESVKLLEADLSQSLEQFKFLIGDLKKHDATQSHQQSDGRDKLDQIEKSILDVKKHVIRLQDPE